MYKNPIQRILFVFVFYFCIELLTTNSRINKCLIEEFRQVQQREEILKKVIQSFINMATYESFSDIYEGASLTGSLNQGTFIASFFKENLKYKGSVITRQIDIDCLMNLRLDLKKPRQCLREIKGKPGYVQFLTRCIPDKGTWYVFIEKATKYIRPVMFKSKVKDRLNGAESNTKEKGVQVFFLYHFLKRGIIFKSINVKVSGKTSKSTVKHIFEIQKDEKLYLTTELDYAFMFKVFYRPRVMLNFLARTQYNVSREISEYIYVLSKTSREQKHNINTTEWTYSFSHIENFILNSFSDAKKLVYVIFKSIFSKSLKFLDEEIVTSYIVKTIVLWRFEDSNLIYFDDWLNDTRIWETIDILFTDLQEALKEGFLKEYFIPEINVLKRFDKSLRDNCQKRIKNIRTNLKTILLISEISEARNILEELLLLFYDGQTYQTLEAFVHNLDPPIHHYSLFH
eukprot:TCONS_00015521-protein